MKVEEVSSTVLSAAYLKIFCESATVDFSTMEK